LRPTSDDSQPDSGSTIAFDTRYDVSTQVDSSAPADKFPEICGSATLAMDVSSTSINVANVTVIAITQGLIFPSGVRNLDKIRFNMPAVLVFLFLILNTFRLPIYSTTSAGFVVIP